MKIAILGRPNVGKSTIFNILSKNQKSIIYDFPGVTRDRIYATANINDIQFTLIDTPGIDKVMQKNAQKNMQNKLEYQAILACTEADIIIFVVEEGVLTGQDTEIANYIRKNNKNIILLKNKSDKNVNPENYYKFGFGSGLKFSSTHRIGFKELKFLILVEILFSIFKQITTNELLIEKLQDIELNCDEEKIFSMLSNEKSSTLYHDVNSSNSKDNFHDKNLELREILLEKCQKYIKPVHNLIVKLDELLKIKNLVTLQDLPRVCIVGRPNSGKSTYINAILQENRLLTNEKAGTTRDAIEIKFLLENKNNQDREVILVDTAGMRKKVKITDDIENLSIRSSIEAIKLSNIAILMIDAQNLIQHQDLEIMDLIVKSGKGLVIAINKCDLVTNDKKKIVDSIIQTNIFQMTNVPVIYCSNFKKINLNQPIESAIKIFDRMNSKIPTSKLNLWLKDSLENHMPPVIFKTKIRIKLKYITQVSCTPMVFKIFGNTIMKDIPNDYIKYLINSLGAKFELFGLPLRLKFIKNDNPYAKK